MRRGRSPRPIPAADAVLIMRLLPMHDHRTLAMALVEMRCTFVVITVGRDRRAGALARARGRWGTCARRPCRR